MGKVQKIFSFIFISLFFSGFLLNAQEALQLVPKEDEGRLGMTVGVNLEGPIGRLFDSDKSAFSAITHIKFGQDWYFRGEVGFENLTFSPESWNERNYHYESNGSFLRAGILYDFFEVDEEGNNDNIFIGLNYGFALQEHGSDEFTIENGYWGDYHGSLRKYVLNTHWVELSFGPRTELLKNLYMGWSLNLRVKLFQDNSEVLQPYSIPGYGKGDNTVNFGFSYVIEYFIPWGKKK